MHTARPNRINIDLQHYKQPWLDYCKAHNTTPSEAFRMVAAKLIGAKKGASSEAGEGGSGIKVRKVIKLTRSEILAAEELADREGFHLTRWIVALVRARLMRGAQLGQHELELLARSNMQILALGRNLNQIARVLNSNPSDPSALHPELIERVMVLLQEHTARVAQVLAANVQRWSVK